MRKKRHGCYGEKLVKKIAEKDKKETGKTCI